jgi:hypothetical protein
MNAAEKAQVAERTINRLKEHERKIQRYAGAKIHDARTLIGSIRTKLILIEEQGMTPYLSGTSWSTIIDCENFEKEQGL